MVMRIKWYQVPILAALVAIEWVVSLFCKRNDFADTEPVSGVSAEMVDAMDSTFGYKKGE